VPAEQMNKWISMRLNAEENVNQSPSVKELLLCHQEAQFRNNLERPIS
jgi:hypothetical protein